LCCDCVILGGIPGSEPFSNENYFPEEGTSSKNLKGITDKEKEIWQVNVCKYDLMRKENIFKGL
jgi:hypothetical protein